MPAPEEYAIGLDVGGTKIAGGLVNLASGRILSQSVTPTRPERGGEAVLADALQLARGLAEAAARDGLPLRGLGVAVCELVDLDGNVTSGHTVRWRGLPARQEFARIAPAVVESDVRAHALAEAAWGAGRPYRLFVFVTVGTGISSCLVQDGRPFAGARGNALVLASSPLTVLGDPRQPPSLEEFASGPALAARYAAHLGRPVVRAEEVLAAAEAGDEAAREIVVGAGRALGAALGWLVNVLDPEAIVIGGGLGSAGGLYRASLVESTRQQIWAEASQSLPLVSAGLGPDAGLAGAALSSAATPATTQG